MIERLIGLGFTQSEARIYLTLLQQPEATGYELAKTAGLQRANTYAALESLAERDIVTRTTTERPARYLAAPPAAVLGRIKQDTTRRVDALVADLATLAAPRPSVALHTVRGREAIIDRVAQLLDGARDRVALCARQDDLDWLASPLRAAARSGCRVVINIFGEADLDFGEVYRHESPDRTVGAHILTLAVDSRVAMIITWEPEPDALYTDQPALVALVEKLVRDEAYLAAIYERHHDQLEASFGPHLVALRTRLLPADQADELISIVGFGADAVGTDPLGYAEPSDSKEN